MEDTSSSGAQRRKKRSVPDPNSWAVTFGKNQTIEEERLRFLTRMGYIALAHYLLYRGLVPTGVYKRRKIDNRSITIYTFDRSKRWGAKLADMMTGMRQAIYDKFVETAFIGINENEENPDETTEVFTVRFCYKKTQAFSVLNNDGQPIVWMEYKNEKCFRHQAKLLVKKIAAVTKKLPPLKDNATPFLKMTYYDDAPNDYAPVHFERCENTYTFKSDPTSYDYGVVTTNETAAAVQLKSIYFTPKQAEVFDDLLFEEAGIKEDGQYVDPNDVEDENEASMAMNEFDDLDCNEETDDDESFI